MTFIYITQVTPLVTFFGPEAGASWECCGTAELIISANAIMAKTKKGCVSDLASLSELNEEIILEELQARYNRDVIYVSDRTTLGYVDQ